ncbi:phosphoglycolate phosphatase [Lachnospiraceae bacterium KM106-2]|nr:phosphoglycolate phosphatase [Lachnospiraceae bacterium KM106-2]
MSNIKYILFDLDGTLTNPKIGITTSVAYALDKMGIHVDDLEKLTPFIGPPLTDSFMEFYDMSKEEAEKAIVYYRERFSVTGLFENEVYEGIPEMLEQLSKTKELAIASSKPTVFVERILEHFGIKDYFHHIIGSNLDGTRCNKDEVVEAAIDEFHSARKEEIIMVGDRKFDIEGGHAHGVKVIGVRFGFAGEGELEAAGADYIAETVAELSEQLEML